MIVVDVNLIAYLLIAGPFTEVTARAFDRDGDWIAPSIWRHELLNVLATSVRNQRLEHGKALDVWAHAPAFIRDAEVAALDVLNLSIACKFATFDCYYVVLAQKLGVQLVTADQRLLEKFDDRAISIEDFANGK